MDAIIKNISENFDAFEEEKDEKEKAVIRNELIRQITNLLNTRGVNQDLLIFQEPRIKSLLGLADGGRVNKAMGGPSETPTEPVATKLTFEQLRTRLPKEITDDIVRLVATSEEALQDFSYIRTQGDVEKFNVKYGVNLVLPQDTA